MRLGIVKERKQKGIMVSKVFMLRAIESGYRRREGEGKKGKSLIFSIYWFQIRIGKGKGKEKDERWREFK